MFDDFVITAAALKFAYAIAAVVGLVLVSRWLDARARKAWRKGDAAAFGAAIRLICSEPQATAIYYGLRLIALAIVVGLLMGCSAASAGPAIPDRYDRQIARAVERHWPAGIDWAWWKAQLYQESRLDPTAVSPAGARGLAQFMPATWAEVTRQLRLGRISPHGDVAIEAGAYYMARPCLANWRPDLRGPLDRLRLAQASYNAGLGNLLTAQRRCGDPPTYAAIVRCLPLVTGKHAEETITYVDRIARWRSMLRAGG